MPELENAGSLSGALGAVALVLAAAHGCGGFLLKNGLMGRRVATGATLLRIVVGLNILGAVGVTLGQLRLLGPSKSVWMLAGFSVLGASSNWSVIARILGRMRTLISSLRNSLSRAVLRTLLAGIALFTLGPALCYPTGWDELVYHHELPRRWLIDGWPAFYADLPYSGFPSLAEILFWLMAPIDRIIAPRLLMWTCWIMGLGWLYQIFRARLSFLASTVLCLAFGLNDTVPLISANCYVESISLLQTCAIVWLTIKSPSSDSVHGNTRTALILGILAGGAAATKLTGVSSIAIACLWYVWQVRARSLPTRSALQFWLIGLTAAGCLAAPFYIRPWVATGNPFYPFLCSWFSSDIAQIETSHHHHLIGGLEFGVKSLAAFFVGPFLLAFRSENYDGEFGWQFVSVVILSCIGAFVGLRNRRVLSRTPERQVNRRKATGRTRRSRETRPIFIHLTGNLSAGRSSVPALQRTTIWFLVVAAWSYLFWFFTSQQARFALAFVIAIYLAAGTGILYLGRSCRGLVLAVIATSSLISVPWQRLDYYLASWLEVVGTLSRTDYVHNLAEPVHLPMVQAVHALTPANAKVMLLYEHRGLYLSRSYVIATPLFQASFFTPPEQFGNAASIMTGVQRAGVTHIVMSKNTIGPDQAVGWYERQQPFLLGLEECVRNGNLRPIWESTEFLLLEVR